MVYLFYTHMANTASTVIVQCAVNTNFLLLWKMQLEVSLLLILFTITCNEDCIIVVFEG